MKQYILPFLCVLITASALGQAAKTSATKPRLVGEAHWKFISGAYVPQDSVGMDYYISRPAEWEDGWDGGWCYDMKWLSAWDASTGAYYPATLRGIMDYSSGGDLPSEIVVQARAVTSLTWTNDSKGVFTYSTAGKLTSVVVYPWDAGAGDWRVNPNGRYTYTYNTSNKRTSWLYESFNVGTGAYQNNYKFAYTYDAAGNMTTQTRQNWDYTLPGWVNADKEIYTWDASNNKIQTRFQGWGGSFWTNADRETYSGFHDHRPELTLHEGYIESISGPLFFNLWQRHTTFNTDDQPVQEYEESWDVATSAWVIESADMATNWYYEPYTLAVTGAATDMNADVVINPVPAGNEMTLEVAWQHAQPFSVDITDILGRERSAWHVPACRQYKETIPVSALAPGNYIVTVRGAKGKVSRNIIVKR